MSFILPRLPYSKDALEPHISAKTLDFHHGKHHSAYVRSLNELIEGTAFANDELETIIKKTANNTAQSRIFNNAAQVWNHNFYWKSMKPNGGGKPTGCIEQMINTDFADYMTFIANFKNAGLTQFGSGWIWLVLKNNKLEIMKTSNADTPIAHNIKPLLTVDIWEHAYYLDYQNRRGDYLDAFFKYLVNWDNANSLLG
ncbi:MAG TPA: superoxide dismutase [Fe] [Lentisphaeria bacterium]|nr:MAG: superoxide dismutase [Lentisphaerae bacterium GWF2_38_69]HBM17334.1 superoxide dismutase [Fe] [Lentisphaeria bacterium]